MKPLLVVAFILLSGSILLAQPEFSEVEFQGYYQRVQGFSFSPTFVEGFDFPDSEGFNGGGFGLTYNLNHWFGIFSNTSFLGGVEQNNLQMKIINQVQGAKITKRGLGPANFYAKGGVGFIRYVFSSGGEDLAIDYSTSFVYGGGAEIKFKEGMWLVLDLSRLSLGLPNLTGFDVPGRDKWDSSYLITTGVMFAF